MHTVSEHVADVAALLAACLPRRTELLDLTEHGHAANPADYRDRMLAEDVLCPLDLPPFDNAQMDGYAVLSTALGRPGTDHPLGAPGAAGQMPGPLLPGHVAAIMTGAPIPLGADAVIPIEQCVAGRFADHARSGAVSFVADAPSGQFVRPRGSDVAAGSVLLRAETRLGPAQLGLLASAGITTASVWARPVVAVISTGRELAAPGTPGAETLRAGQGHRHGDDATGGAVIYDANSAALRAGLSECGAIVSTHRYSSDDPSGFRTLFERCVAEADLIVTSGGVSAGDHEVVRESLAPLGVEFRSVQMQPGGPQGFGAMTIAVNTDAGPAAIRTVPVLCFPGNPVSTLVSFEMFLRPALRRALGVVPAERPMIDGVLTESVESVKGRLQLRRAVLHADGSITLLGGPSSHLLHAYAHANALVHIPEEIHYLPAGSSVRAWRLDV